MTSVLLAPREGRSSFYETFGGEGELDVRPTPGQLPLWRRPEAGDGSPAPARDFPGSTDGGVSALTGATLEHAIEGVCDRLLRAEPARCPACGGAMHPAAGAGGRSVEGYCADCGASLT